MSDTKADAKLDARAARAPRQVIEFSDSEAEDSCREEDEAPAGAPSAASEPAAHAEGPGRFQDATIGFIEGVGRRAWAYADAHPHTVLYGTVGFVFAVLILVLGLWSTIVIAVFVGVGAAVGQLRDGEGGIIDFFNRLFGGKR